MCFVHLPALFYGRASVFLVFPSLRGVSSVHLTADRVDIPPAFPAHPEPHDWWLSVQTPAAPPFLAAIPTFPTRVPFDM